MVSDVKNDVADGASCLRHKARAPACKFSCGAALASLALASPRKGAGGASPTAEQRLRWRLSTWASPTTCAFGGTRQPSLFSSTRRPATALPARRAEPAGVSLTIFFHSHLDSYAAHCHGYLRLETSAESRREGADERTGNRADLSSRPPTPA